MLDEIRQDHGTVNADGRKRSLSIGYAVKELGLGVGEKIIGYIVPPPGNEFEMDAAINGELKLLYIVFA